MKRPSFSASAFVALVLNNLGEGPCLRIVFVQKVHNPEGIQSNPVSIKSETHLNLLDFDFESRVKNSGLLITYPGKRVM